MLAPFRNSRGPRWPRLRRTHGGGAAGVQSHGLWVSPDARAMPPATFPWRGLEPAPLRLLPHAKLRLASTQGLAPYGRHCGQPGAAWPELVTVAGSACCLLQGEGLRRPCLSALTVSADLLCSPPRASKPAATFSSRTHLRKETATTSCRMEAR